MNLGIKDKQAVVIGGTSGIGLATARLLLEEGVRVAVVSRRPQQKDKELAELASRYQGKFIALAADYNDTSAMSKTIQSIQQQHGPISIFIGSSGGPPVGRALDIETDQLEAVLQNNLTGIISAASNVLPEMTKQRWGRIVFITTSGVKQPLDNMAYSNISRSALTAYAKTLASEVASDNITVNTIMPGKIATERLDQITVAKGKLRGVTAKEQSALDIKEIPTGRYGKPSEIASLIVFLAAEQAAYITGSNIAVDGGYVKS